MTSPLYAGAGVDLDAADAAKHRIADVVAGTRTSLTLGQVGAFGGMVRLPSDIVDPVLVMSTDGVGTKVLVAQRAGRYGTVGEDLVNHSVNDILVHGARPVAFMDYVAGHRLPVEMIAAIVEGIGRACKVHSMVLAGGETAQMPGLYADHTFDLAGTIIGVASEAQLIHGDRITPGDVLVAYASNGLHTNGYTLARSVLFDHAGLAGDAMIPGTETRLIDGLLAVHRSYAAAITPVLGRIHGLAHITGGGIAGNLVRILPADCEAVVDAGSWAWPPLFRLIADRGGVSVAEMRDVFNLGIGMIAVVQPGDVTVLRDAARDNGVAAWECGTVCAGARGVRFDG